MSQIHTVLGASSSLVAKRPEDASNAMAEMPVFASELSFDVRPGGEIAWLALMKVWMEGPVCTTLTCSCQTYTVRTYQ